MQDCSRGGTYHNKRFRDAAEQRDLHISYDSRIGWSITEPTDALIEYILRQGWSEIHMNRQDGYTARGIGGRGTAGGTPTITPKPSSTRKLQCPCCGNSVRATKAVRILCMDCMEQMIEV